MRIRGAPMGARPSQYGVTRVKIWPGRPFPLGATWDGEGVNFALFSENASTVDLCLFDAAQADAEIARIRLPEVTAHVWHGYLPGLGPGQLYGYRVNGPFEPHAGHRFNSNKLLVDPYAVALLGQVDWDSPAFGYPLGAGDDADLLFDERDDAWGVPLGVVVDRAFDWTGDRRPNTPWHRTVIYEVHVKGMTMRHPDVPENQRGTYTGLASPPIVAHLKKLGVTAVELLPVHAFLQDGFLVGKGLTNYWGYNSLNYFAPESRYAMADEPGRQVREFKTMVKTLHQAGIEVILDVVYNHTAEGNHLGPTLSFKGIDNKTYYRLMAGNERYYMDYTGTGNSLNVRHPQVLKLIMDSLRYWVTEMHVDGFRFDLASALARELHEVDRLSAFFDIIHQDPILSRVKLIAEPWDVGEGGYQVGNFPELWTEWNGKYRDTIRSFWKGDEHRAGEMASRLTGSSDLYSSDGRHPYASINFVVAHDGFTLRDLVSYNEKHNEANGEGNRDGESHNLSWNCGVEGETDAPEINELRARQQRNFLATLLLSQGVPMICGGDELGRTQRGNNNAYCQDNEISWFDWDLDEERAELLDFARKVVALRHEHPVLRRRKFFQGRRIRGSEVKDLTWLDPSGDEMTDEQWETPTTRAFGLRMAGDLLNELDDHGDRVQGDSLMLLLNAWHECVPFVIPTVAEPERWAVLVDTARPELGSGDMVCASGEEFPLEGRSLALLRLVERG
jgi:isoamylase